MFSTGIINNNRENLKVTNDGYKYNQVTQVNAFLNKSEILTIFANVNKSWNCIHDSMITEVSRELFSADLIVNNNMVQNDETMTINTNDNCMCELNLLNGETILSILNIGSTVNLISADMLKTMSICQHYQFIIVLSSLSKILVIQL